MSPEQQRIAIAEACGWKWWVHLPGQNSGHDGKRFLAEDGDWRNHNKSCEADMTEDIVKVEPLPPNYPRDLNAMHEAEKVVNEKWPTYCEQLLEIVEPEPMSLEVCHYWNLLHATAAQRAEAFLRTLNLWTD